MEFEQTKQFGNQKKADALVIPFWKGKKGAEPAASFSKELFRIVEAPLEAGDFKGKEGECAWLYLNGAPEKRVILVGLGLKEKISVENLRRSYGCLARSCLSKKLKKLNLILPEAKAMSEENIVRGVSEGILLANYFFTCHPHHDDEHEDGPLLEKITFIGTHPHAAAIAEKAAAICDGVYYARDLTNGNADLITPQYLVKCARGLAKEQPAIRTTVFDKKRIEKEKLDLLLAVNRGSSLDPAFIIMQYRGAPKSKEHTVVVGKGITYDTGGLNIKGMGMETMKCDMGGAAACFGTILAAAELGLKVNLTVVIPTTENSVDANSFKPGDVYPSYLGKWIEMTNSDAEGRLILADGLAYAVKNLKPTVLIDIATLTGAIDIALGAEASGMMSTNDNLAQALTRAGDATFERVWRMPLYDEYKDKLKSDIADLKSWNGRPGSACVAATFLRHFVDESIPWAHLDIASTAYINEPKKYIPKYATGVGVRLLIEFLEEIAKRT